MQFCLALKSSLVVDFLTTRGWKIWSKNLSSFSFYIVKEFFPLLFFSLHLKLFLAKIVFKKLGERVDHKADCLAHSHLGVTQQWLTISKKSISSIRKTCLNYSQLPSLSLSKNQPYLIFSRNANQVTHWAMGHGKEQENEGLHGRERK